MAEGTCLAVTVDTSCLRLEGSLLLHGSLSYLAEQVALGEMGGQRPSHARTLQRHAAHGGDLQEASNVDEGRRSRATERSYPGNGRTVDCSLHKRYCISTYFSTYTNIMRVSVHLAPPG